jgi:hypothetical protein
MLDSLAEQYGFCWDRRKRRVRSHAAIDRTGLAAGNCADVFSPFAWGDVGNRVICRIAYEELKPETKAASMPLLRSIRSFTALRMDAHGRICFRARSLRQCLPGSRFKRSCSVVSGKSTVENQT